MKKRLSLLLAVIMLLSVFLGMVGCKKDDVESEETTISTTLSGGEKGDDDAKLYEDLPTGDYDGYTFRILNGQSNYAMTRMDPVETQDSLSQAMFNRNSLVEQTLNVTIEEEFLTYPACKTIQDEARKLNSTNDYAYDIIFNELAYQTPLAQEGAYLALDEYEMYLNLKKPWWFTDAMDSIKIDGRTCELFGELHLMYYESIWATVFNQKIFTEKKIEFPYDLVRNGEWTLDKFKETAALASSGDDGIYGVYSSGDYFVTAMTAACDFKLITQDEADILLPYEDDELLVNIYEAILPLYESNGDHMDNWIMVPADSNARQSGIFTESKDGNLFVRGKAAIFADAVGNYQQLRNCDFDYGILPLPKYTKDQEKYVSNIFRGAASCGIPVTAPDVERTCTVLEHLSANSYRFVTDEYYEVVIQSRTVRDNDSIEMLDIIFGKDKKGITNFELDAVYGIGFSGVIKLQIADYAPEIKSQLDSIKGTSVKTNINNVIKAYK
ncbi:MAG: hypothetical protein J6A83_01950 [Clostridia bacterium]|nr:hypothetical protein [Clostridia bacterium]